LLTAAYVSDRSATASKNNKLQQYTKKNPTRTINVHIVNSKRGCFQVFGLIRITSNNPDAAHSISSATEGKLCAKINNEKTIK
jgi:hypothetical protein